MTNLTPNMRAIAFVLFAFAAWNIADAFLKYTTSFYSFAEAALYPTFFYAIYIVIFAKKFGGLKAVTKTKKLKLHLIRSIFGTCCFICVVIAFKFTTLAETYTLVLTAPFWVAILSIFFFKETIGWHRWLVIGIGFIGVLVVLRPGLISVQPASISALMAAAFFAVFVVCTRRIGKDEPLINMVLYPILTDIIILIPIIIFMGNWHPPQAEHLIVFAASGLFYLIGTSLSSIGFASGDSSLLAPLHYSQIIWGALIGYFFFHEKPEIWTFIGAAIIVMSGIYLVYREHLAHKHKP